MLSVARPLPASLLQHLKVVCPAGECELHAVALDDTALATQNDEHWLSDEDRSRAARFHRAESARRWTRTRAALRELLAERIGLARASAPFLIGPAGKPCIGGNPPDAQATGQAWRFSVSHSHTLALIVIATVGEPGVDIERIRIDRDHASLLQTIGSESEKSEFDALGVDPDVRASAFMRLWTRKEAVVKASGAGIGFGLPRVDVGAGATPRLSIDGVGQPRVVLADLPSPPGYCAALCVLPLSDADKLHPSRRSHRSRPGAGETP